MEKNSDFGPDSLRAKSNLSRVSHLVLGQARLIPNFKKKKKKLAESQRASAELHGTRLSPIA